MTTCTCCGKPSGKFAWCTRCSPAIIYKGPTETGLAFRCRDHVKEVEIIISFELGEVESGN